MTWSDDQRAKTHILGMQCDGMMVMLGSVEGNSKREKQQIKIDGSKKLWENPFLGTATNHYKTEIEMASTSLPSHPRLESGWMAPKIFLKNCGIEIKLKNRLTE